MKFLFKLVPVLIFTLLLVSCEHEPAFVHAPPFSSKSWLDYSDSDYCAGDFSLNDSSNSVIVRSNFEVLSDTQWSFLVRIPKGIKNNFKGIETLGFKIMNGDVGGILKDENFTAKIVETGLARFISQQVKIVSKNFVILHKGEDLFVMNGDIKVYTESPDFPLDSFEMSFKNILVEKSYVRVWVNGGIASPFSWDIDVKGGNEFNPESTIVLIPEFGKVLQIGLGLVDGKKKYEISPTEKQFTNFKNRSETWSPISGYFYFDKFYYKDIVKANFRIKYESPDKTSTYSVDSVKINYSRIPF